MRPAIQAAIAHARRLRLPHLLGCWALLTFCTTPLAKHATLGAPARGGADWVLGTGWLVAMVTALVVGVVVAQTNAVDSLLVARGHSVHRILSGRWLGAAAVSVGASVIAGVTYAVAARTWALPLSATLVVWTGFVALEALVLTSLGCLLGRFARPTVALAAGAALFVVGHLADETAALVRAGDAAIPWLFVVLPDLDRFNAHAAVLTNTAPQWSSIVTAMALAVCWTLALTSAALWVTHTPNRVSHQEPAQ